MALPANPASPSSPFHSPSDWFTEHTQRTHRNTSRGQKRRADDDADPPPTISGGFKKLRISPPRPPRTIDRSHGSDVDLNYAQNRTASPAEPYQPPTVTGDQDHDLVDQPIYHESTHQLHHPRPITHRNQLLPNQNLCDTPPPQRLPSNNEDFMPVDDHPHRIFISDLDAAIAEIEAEERAAKEQEQERAFFLPDEVDKEISSAQDSILKGALRAGAPHAGPSQALVLYRDPLSISVPEETDAVRKAVHEARQRIRERGRQSSDNEDQALLVEPPPVAEHEIFGYPLDRQWAAWQHNNDSIHSENHDPDAMEVE